MPGTSSSDIPVTEGVGETEFDMLTSDVEVAIEWAVALPEFVLPEQLFLGLLTLLNLISHSLPGNTTATSTCQLICFPTILTLY